MVSEADKCLLSLQMFQLHFQETLTKAGGAGCDMGLFPLYLSNAFARINGSGQNSLCCLESVVATAGKGRQSCTQLPDHQLLKM